MASYLYRTATTTYPCYLPVLREFSRSWPYKTCQKYKGKQKKTSLWYLKPDPIHFFFTNALSSALWPSAS